MARVACIGECMLELSGADNKAMTLSYGGDTLNTAVYLSRLGVETDYVTALGDDPYSDWMVEQWRGEGVGTDLVVRAAGRVPGLYAIRNQPGGERQFFYWRDQAPARDLFGFRESTALAARLARYELVYLSGISLSLYSPADRETLFAVLDAARTAGSRVVFDTNYRPRGWPDAATARDVMTALLARVDIAAPTPGDDIAVFGDADATSCADRLHAAGVAEVVVKLDAEGCLVSMDGVRKLVPTVPRADPVDTSAAGDSFNAGYLAARLAGAAPATAARHGHRLAGEVIMHRGAIIPRDAMPGSNL
jgi:2-dehydro-3-deoxygluconokinase